MGAPASFEFAKEVTTQLITLSTAVIGVTTTFAKDISPRVTRQTRTLLYASWVLLLLSIICGVWTLGGLTGTLAKVAEPKADAVYATNITVPSVAQTVLFVIGVLFLIVHAIRNAAR